MGSKQAQERKGGGSDVYVYTHDAYTWVLSDWVCVDIHKTYMSYIYIRMYKCVPTYPEGAVADAVAVKPLDGGGGLCLCRVGMAP